MEQLVVGLFLVFFTFEFIVEFVLNELNLAYVRGRRPASSIPDFMAGKMTADDYNKSVQYTLAKGTFQRYSEVYSRVLTLAVLFGGFLPFCDRWANYRPPPCRLCPMPMVSCFASASA
jgi:hypothetical protein